MSTLPPVNNVLAVLLNHGCQSATPTVKLHFQYTGEPLSVTQATALATSISGVYHTNLAPQLNEAYELASVEVIDLSDSTGAAGVYSTPVAGEAAGLTMPANVCTLINHKIPRKYRGGKPRSYTPFGTTLGITSDTSWSGTYVAAMQSAWNAFIAGVLAVTTTGITITNFVNVSYYSGFSGTRSGPHGKEIPVPAVRSTPVVDIITASTVNGTFGSQRRRLRG